MHRRGLSHCGLSAGFLHCLDLTFTWSTLAGGSWWLPGVTLSFGHCRSKRINEGKVKGTATGEAQYVCLQESNVANIQEVGEKTRR